MPRSLFVLSPAGNSSFYWEARTRVEPAGAGLGGRPAGRRTAQTPGRSSGTRQPSQSHLSGFLEALGQADPAGHHWVGGHLGRGAPPETERNSERPFVRSRVTPVPWGPQRGGRAVFSARGPSFSEASAARSHASGLLGPRPILGGEAEVLQDPPRLLRQCACPAGSRLFVKLTALLGPRLWHPGREAAGAGVDGLLWPPQW